MSNDLGSSVKVPARKVNGHWEFFYGGDIPIKDGAVADIIVDKCMIDDCKFLANLKKKSSYKIMSSGTRLMVALTIKDHSKIESQLHKYLQEIPIKQISADKRFSPFGVRQQTRFVEITVGQPGQHSLALEGKTNGGVWLELEGMEPQSLNVSHLSLPPEIKDTEVDSLNYAFTLLSTVYEPWRRSHTGNIYHRIFYQEQNGIWNPLNVLRNAAIATEEHAFIKKQWEAISDQLNLSF